MGVAPTGPEDQFSKTDVDRLFATLEKLGAAAG